MNHKFFIIYEHVFNYTEQTFIPEMGGVQRYLYELGLIIKNLGHDVTVVQFGNKEIHSSLDGLEVIQLGIKGTSKFKKSVKYIVDNLNFNNSNDFILWGADTISFKLKSNIKSISIQHGIACDMLELNTPTRRSLKNLGLTDVYKIMQRRNALRSFDNADIKVCVDYNYLNWYRTFQKKNSNQLRSIEVIPNFSKVPALISSNHNSDDRIKISFARRFVYKRGVTLMISVAKLLLQNYHNLEIIFAGDGPMLKDIQDLQSKFKDKITITSFEPSETFSFHAGIDIAVIPTIGSEGTSLSLLEAMACDTSVVCTNVGGMTNIVIDNFNGLISNPNTEDLYKSISRLIESDKLRERLSKAARSTIEDGFSYELWRQKWEHVINRAIEEC